MQILSVYDEAFKPYGRVITGMEKEAAEAVAVLKRLPLPEATDYVPEEPLLQQLPAKNYFQDHVYGGMPIQMGWCNGHNTKLNCLEYHRDSEINLGAEDFILLLATMSDIADGRLDTAKVKAFRAPAGVPVEVYATSLHYAPCHTDPATGFHVLIVLPKGTNYAKPAITAQSGDDRYLWAANKWLLAHPESSEAAQGAQAALTGVNIDIAGLL